MLKILRKYVFIKIIKFINFKRKTVLETSNPPYSHVAAFKRGDFFT